MSKEGFPPQVFLDKIKVQEYICGLCQKVLNNPYQCKNGHMACLSCLQKAVEDAECCVECDTKIIMGNLSVSLLANKQMRYLNVCCCHGTTNEHCSSKSCDWIGLLQDYNEHIEGCAFRPTVCPHCDDEMICGDLPHHSLICGERPFTCECKTEMKFSEVNEHKKICGSVLLECGFFEHGLCDKSCNGHVLRRDLVSHCGTDKPEELMKKIQAKFREVINELRETKEENKALREENTALKHMDTSNASLLEDEDHDHSAATEDQQSVSDPELSNSQTSELTFSSVEYAPEYMSVVGSLFTHSSQPSEAEDHIEGHSVDNFSIQEGAADDDSQEMEDVAEERSHPMEVEVSNVSSRESDSERASLADGLEQSAEAHLANSANNEGDNVSDEGSSLISSSHHKSRLFDHYSESHVLSGDDSPLDSMSSPGDDQSETSSSSADCEPLRSDFSHNTTPSRLEQRLQRVETHSIAEESDDSSVEAEWNEEDDLCLGAPSAVSGRSHASSVDVVSEDEDGDDGQDPQSADENVTVAPLASVSSVEEMDNFVVHDEATFKSSFKCSKSAGAEVLPPKDSYEGERNPAGERHGQGKLTFSYGRGVYEGAFENDKKHGHGVQIWKVHNETKTEIYRGDWLLNFKCGQGRMEFDNGNVYEGGWVKDKHCGQGKLVYADGSSHEGGWQADQKNGQGVATSTQGVVTVGVWKNDRLVKPRNKKGGTVDASEDVLGDDEDGDEDLERDDSDGACLDNAMTSKLAIDTACAVLDAHVSSDNSVAEVTLATAQPSIATQIAVKVPASELPFTTSHVVGNSRLKNVVDSRCVSAPAPMSSLQHSTVVTPRKVDVTSRQTAGTFIQPLASSRPAPCVNGVWKSGEVQGREPPRGETAVDNNKRRYERLFEEKGVKRPKLLRAKSDEWRGAPSSVVSKPLATKR